MQLARLAVIFLAGKRPLRNGTLKEYLRKEHCNENTELKLILKDLGQEGFIAKRIDYSPTFHVQEALYNLHGTNVRTVVIHVNINPEDNQAFEKLQIAASRHLRTGVAVYLMFWNRKLRMNDFHLRFPNIQNHGLGLSGRLGFMCMYASRRFRIIRYVKQLPRVIFRTNDIANRSGMISVTELHHEE